MAITKTSYVERVLIVLNPDGALKGAHQESMESVKDGDEVLQARMLPAQPVDASALASILPDQASLAAQVQSLTDQLAAMTAGRDDAVSAREAAEAATDAKAAEIASLTASHAAQIESLTASHAAQIESLTASHAAQIESLTTSHAAQIESLTASKDAEIAVLQAQLHPVDAGGAAILTPVQIRLGLLAAGITAAQVLTAIDAIPDATAREVAMTHWDYSLSYHRDHPLVAQLAAAFGLTADQVDAMWTAAATL